MLAWLNEFTENYLKFVELKKVLAFACKFKRKEKLGKIAYTFSMAQENISDYDIFQASVLPLKSAFIKIASKFVKFCRIFEIVKSVKWQTFFQVNWQSYVKNVISSFLLLETKHAQKTIKHNLTINKWA